MYIPYEVKYLLNGVCLDNIYYNNLYVAICDCIYWMKQLLYKVDQIQIYKNNILIAELNK